MKKLATLSLILTALSLSGCGFHLRGANKSTKAYPSMQVIADNSQWQSQLSSFLKNLGIKQDPKSHYTLRSSNYSLSNNIPNISDSTTTITITYTLSTSIALLKDQAVLAKQSFSSSQQLISNNSQAYSATIPATLKQTLQNNLLANVYQWLTANNTLKLIGSRHANQS